MNIVVTGGTGFLGQKLAQRLVKNGSNVTVIGRNENIGEYLQSQGIRFLKTNLEDQKAVIYACKNADYIFHCGALSSPWGRYLDFYHANVLGTRHIIQACQTHAIKRLIYVSTPSVYFDFSHRLNIKETDYLTSKPANHYVATKLIAEQEITKAHQQGLPVISIRPRAIFGPGDTTILPRLLKANSRTGIPLINQGQALIDMTYVGNVVDALLLCQSAPNHLLGRIFNITNGQPMYLVDLLAMLAQKLECQLKLKKLNYHFAYSLAQVMEIFSKSLLNHREPILTRYTVGVLSFSQTLDITSAKSELGYQPRIDIEQGLNSFCQWWKSQNASCSS